ncbi:tyrosine-protein phosphatase non-receptor type 14 [Anoplolepis gracilipes]|uniref:tyrosine-protein phosphatase non-receptor type 14 n=1 Tax=Anoplolepis gracilipes TaxID=354296 RepID=UPI003B9EFC28
MPFKFHLKKSKQYNVVSKSHYVICVELLDATSIECTLSIDSVGQECLNNVIQRLGLGQPELFGLRYIYCHSNSDSDMLRWIDMDKPLKRQLEKDGKNLTVYLRVMYYITDAQFLQDEMTRYHYYLQLKSDILEERIHCNSRQASLLASYSMQAEFGNYSSERHTVDYLQQYTFFPNEVIKTNLGRQESLLHTAIHHYKSLINVTQANAEELYISMVMQLEGYGNETFAAKDNSNNKVILGISVNGVMVTYPNTQTQFYRWKDISNVINVKKTFRIECQLEGEEAKQFVLTESRNAKYMWRLCIAQHTFYMQYQEHCPLEKSNSYLDNDINDSSEQTGSVSLDNRTVDSHTRWTSYNDLSTSPFPVVSVSSTDINNLRALLPSYRPAPDYETAVQMKYNGGNPPQPYYANQSAIVGSDISCLLGNVVNRNRY